MEFELGESRILYRSTVERFVGAFDGTERNAERGHPAGFSRARWAEMAELGILALPIADAAGGIDGDAGDCAVVAQAIGHGIAAEPWVECGFWPAFLLQGRAFDEGIATGNRLCAVAFSEPRREGIWMPETRIAHRPDGGYRLSGEKTLVLGGADAELFLVTGDLDGEAHCFLVPRDAAGVGVRPYRIVDGSNAAAVTFDDVALAEGDLVASGDLVQRSVVAAMLMAAAEMVGLSQRLFDETLAYVKTREQFGQPIGRFQVIQHRMVDHYVSLEKMRSTLLWAVDEGWDGRADRIAGAKAFIARLAREVAHDAIQLHGGMGITDELLVSHAMKRILLLSRLFVDPVQGIQLYREGMAA